MRRGVLVRLVTLAAMAVGWAAFGARDAGAQATSAIAIVTNPRTATSDLSFLELRKIFLGEIQFWDDNSRIVLLVRAPVAR